MAEIMNPRNRKTKWSSDPNGSTWSQDKGKFGYQLMQKMGWADGKGLGRDESGSMLHVKVAKKSDNRGVGASGNAGDNWLEIQDIYSNLLERINENKANDVDAKASQPKTTMMQEKTASSKRLFYRKFIVNKDASGYSAEDAAMILGQSSASTSRNPSPGPVDSKTEEIKSVIGEYEFQTSTFSLQAYFKKQKESNSASVSRQESAANSDDDAEERPMGLGLGFATSNSNGKRERDSENEDVDMDQKSSKKKAKKQKFENVAQTSSSEDEELKQEAERRRLKHEKKERKRAARAEAEAEAEEAAKKQTKKDKKDKKREAAKRQDSSDSEAEVAAESVKKSSKKEKKKEKRVKL